MSTVYIINNVTTSVEENNKVLRTYVDSLMLMTVSTNCTLSAGQMATSFLVIIGELVPPSLLRHLLEIVVTSSHYQGQTLHLSVNLVDKILKDFFSVLLGRLVFLY